MKKSYPDNTVAIFLVLGDPRWRVCFPQGTTDSWRAENAASNERIDLATIGAVVQDVQLAVTAAGLTSSWLSGGGEATTNRELSAMLGYPPLTGATGTVPVGFPKRDATSRYRRPLEQIVHWNGCRAAQMRLGAMMSFHVEELRPSAVYRTSESPVEWEDADEERGAWRDAFTGAAPGRASPGAGHANP